METYRKCIRGNGKAEIQETIRNNSVKRTGLFVEKPGADISPVIYLEEHYEKLCRGQGFEETMDGIWALYLRHAGDRPFEPAEFSDWGRAEEKVFVRLVHYGNNERPLKTCRMNGSWTWRRSIIRGRDKRRPCPGPDKKHPPGSVGDLQEGAESSGIQEL